MCSKYVREGSRLQLNLSTAMRDATVRAIDNPAQRRGALDAVFDGVLVVVQQLIADNVWPGFHKSSAFTHLRNLKQRKLVFKSLQGSKIVHMS